MVYPLLHGIHTLYSLYSLYSAYIFDVLCYDLIKRYSGMVGWMGMVRWAATKLSRSLQIVSYSASEIACERSKEKMHVQTSSKKVDDALRQEREKKFQLENRGRRWDDAAGRQNRNSSNAWIQWTDFSSITFIFKRNEWLKQFKCVYMLICKVGGWQCMW